MFGVEREGSDEPGVAGAGWCVPAHDEQQERFSGPAVSTWWQLAVVVLLGLGLLWAVLAGLLWLLARRQSEPTTLGDAVRLGPDLLRLVRRLTADRSLPWGVRVRLFLLVGYLLLPVDLVPDFLPVIGYADDVVLVALVLRSVVRAAGTTALARHWPGTPRGLRTVQQLTGLA